MTDMTDIRHWACDEPRQMRALVYAARSVRDALPLLNSPPQDAQDVMPWANAPPRLQIDLRTSVNIVMTRLPLCLAHVAVLIDGYLDDIGPQWTLESASHAGFVRLLGRLVARERAAQSSSNHRQQQQISSSKEQFERAIRQAAVAGHVPVLAWWCHEFLPDQWNAQHNREIWEIAASRGHLHVVQWLHAQDRLWPLVHEPPVSCNHPTIVYWLHDQSLSIPLTISIDKAVQHRRLRFLQWLVVHNRWQLHELTCTPNATVLAAAHGDLPALRWLRANRPDCCSEWALSYAGMQGHLQIVQWLQDQYPNVAFMPPGSHVMKNRHIHVVQWMLTQFRWSREQARHDWLNDMIECAADTGQIEMVRHLHQQRVGSAFSVCVSQHLLGPIAWFHHVLWPKELSQEQSLWTSILRMSLWRVCGAIMRVEADAVHSICSRQLGPTTSIDRL